VSAARFEAGHLARHPLPAGIVGALGLNGYQLLVDLAGVGAGRLGSHAFLLVAPEPDPTLPDPGTQLALHHPRVRSDAEAAAFAQLAAQLGYLRLTGYRLVPVRSGLRSKINVIDPATGAIALTVPDRHPGRWLGGGATVSRLLALAGALPAAGPPADSRSPELLRQVLLALALRDESIAAAEAVDVAERALELMRSDAGLDPPAAVEAAKRSREIAASGEA